MAYKLLTNGSLYTVAPSLGNILAMSTLRVVRDNFFWPNAEDGTICSQASSNTPERELSIYILGGELSAVIGGSSNDGLATISGDLSGTLDITLDLSLSTLSISVGSTVILDAESVSIGAGRYDGMGWRTFARSGSTSTGTTGAFLAPNGAEGGDEAIYTDGTLIRNYVMPSSGTAITDTENGQDATVYGGTPTWVSDEPPTGDTITVANPLLSPTVYQRNALNQYTATFDVTYTGSPSSLSYRLLDASDSSVVTDWSIFDSSPTGGASSVSITRSSSNTEYLVEVRQDASGTITSLQTAKWGVGALVWMGGQSLTEGMDSRYTTSSLPDNFYRYDQGSGFNRSTTGQGMTNMAATLNQELGCIIVLCNTAVRSTCLTEECSLTHTISDYWNDPSGDMYQDSLSAISGMTDGAMEVEFSLWMQGGTDADQGVTKSVYKSAFEQFITRLRGEVSSRGGADLKIVTGTLGGSGSVPDVDRQAIREAINEVIASDPLMLPLPIFPYSTYDGTHPDLAGNIGLGVSAALIYNGNSAPFVSGASMDGAELTLTFNEDLDASLTNYALNGVRVVASGSVQSIYSFSRTGAREATITLSDTPSDISDVDVYLCWGSKGTNSLISYPRDSSEIYTIPYFSTGNDFSAVVNQPPTANAGIDQSVAAGATVQLDGTGSTDGDGTIVSYSWAQTAGDAVILTGASTSTPSFTAPSTNAQQTLTFELTVTDNEAATDTDTVDVVVAAEVVQPTESNLTATLTGIVDGTYITRVIDTDTDTVLFSGTKAWASESASFTLSVEAGTNVEYYAYDSGTDEAGLQIGVTA